jgi:lipopolysaccharide export system permease protein
LPAAFLAALLLLVLTPWANSGIERIKFEQRDAADISGVRTGRFNEYREGNLVIFAQQGESGGLSEVFLQRRHQEQLDVVLAKEAVQSVDAATGERFVVLRNGARYEGLPGRADYSISRFEEYALRMPKLDLADFSLHTKSQPSALLWASDDLRARAELQSRIAAPLAVMVFAILAVPLARAQPRKDIYGRVVLAILVYFVFMNLQRVAEQWMEVGATPAWLGMWWVAAVMLGVAGVIVLLDSHWLAARLRAYRSRPTG